ncbi:MAG: competence protein ComK [Acholeplasmataceae bacterium]
MIEYIEHAGLMTKVVKTHEILYFNKPMITIIKNLCYDKLFSYEGYKKAVRKRLDMSYRLPLYIDEDLQLFPIENTRNYENMWINSVLIKDIHMSEDGVSITFFSMHKIYVNTSLNSINKQIKRLNQIRNLLSKHFHV